MKIGYLYFSPNHDHYISSWNAVSPDDPNRAICSEFIQYLLQHIITCKSQIFLIGGCASPCLFATAIQSSLQEIEQQHRSGEKLGTYTHFPPPPSSFSTDFSLCQQYSVQVMGSTVIVLHQDQMQRVVCHTPHPGLLAIDAAPDPSECGSNIAPSWLSIYFIEPPITTTTADTMSPKMTQLITTFTKYLSKRYTGEEQFQNILLLGYSDVDLSQYITLSDMEDGWHTDTELLHTVHDAISSLPSQGLSHSNTPSTPSSDATSHPLPHQQTVQSRTPTPPAPTPLIKSFAQHLYRHLSSLCGNMISQEFSRASSSPFICFLSPNITTTKIDELEHPEINAASDNAHDTPPSTHEMRSDEEERQLYIYLSRLLLTHPNKKDPNNMTESVGRRRNLQIRYLNRSGFVHSGGNPLSSIRLINGPMFLSLKCRDISMQSTSIDDLHNVLPEVYARMLDALLTNQQQQLMMATHPQYSVNPLSQAVVMQHHLGVRSSLTGPPPHAMSLVADSLSPISGNRAASYTTAIPFEGPPPNQHMAMPTTQETFPESMEYSFHGQDAGDTSSSQDSQQSAVGGSTSQHEDYEDHEESGEQTSISQLVDVPLPLSNNSLSQSHAQDVHDDRDVLLDDTCRETSRDQPTLISTQMHSQPPMSLPPLEPYSFSDETTNYTMGDTEVNDQETSHVNGDDPMCDRHSSQTQIVDEADHGDHLTNHDMECSSTSLWTQKTPPRVSPPSPPPSPSSPLPGHDQPIIEHIQLTPLPSPHASSAEDGDDGYEQPVIRPASPPHAMQQPNGERIINIVYVNNPYDDDDEDDEGLFDSDSAPPSPPPAKRPRYETRPMSNCDDPVIIHEVSHDNHNDSYTDNDNDNDMMDNAPVPLLKGHHPGDLSTEQPNSTLMELSNAFINSDHQDESTIAAQSSHIAGIFHDKTEDELIAIQEAPQQPADCIDLTAESSLQIEHSDSGSTSSPEPRNNHENGLDEESLPHNQCKTHHTSIPPQSLAKRRVLSRIGRELHVIPFQDHHPDNSHRGNQMNDNHIEDDRNKPSSPKSQSQTQSQTQSQDVEIHATPYTFHECAFLFILSVFDHLSDMDDSETALDQPKAIDLEKPLSFHVLFRGLIYIHTNSCAYPTPNGLLSSLVPDGRIRPSATDTAYCRHIIESAKYTCPICPEQDSRELSQKDIQKHVSKSHKLFICARQQIITWNIHMSNDRQYFWRPTYQPCKNLLKNASSCSTHRTSHSRLFFHPRCRREFVDMKSAQKHVISCPYNKRLMKCPRETCRVIFTSYDHVIDHFLTRHAPPGLLQNPAFRDNTDKTRVILNDITDSQRRELFDSFFTYVQRVSEYMR